MAFALGSSPTMSGADWPSFRGPGHDGISAETIAWPKDGPKPLWTINVGIGHSAVSVVGDRAYTMGNTNDTDTVFNLDAAFGGFAGSPRVIGDRVFLNAISGGMALDARTGKRIWKSGVGSGGSTLLHTDSVL